MEMEKEDKEGESGMEIIEEFSEKWVALGGTVSKSKDSNGDTICTFSGASDIKDMSKEMFDEYSDKKKK